MSKRVNELSKELSVSNKELIAIINEGFPELDIKTHSNSIPTTYLDEVESFVKKKLAGSEEKPVSPKESAKAEESAKSAAPEKVVPVGKTPPPAPVPAAKAPPPTPAPAVKAPIPPPPAAKAPVPSPPAAKAPAPVSPAASKPAPVPPPVSAPPPVSKPAAIVPPAVAKAPAPVPPPVSRPAPVPPVVKAPSTVPPPAAKSPVSVPPPVSRPNTPPPLHKTPGAVPTIPAAPAGESAPVVADEEMQSITVRPPIVVRDFAIALNLRPFRLISELMEMGIFASMNQTIEEDVAVRIAKKHGIVLEVRHRGEAQPQKKEEAPKPDHDDPKLLESRPPVVCVLGHVDHGKTTLLDFYRKSSVVTGEAGGITQHVGAYSVEQKGKRITFLDTPGHAAFSKMRERGAEVTDIAILVVAADDGFMPQTDEALKFAKKNNVQIVIAINKVDAKGANIDRIKQQMQQRNIASEDWGGTTLTTPVSALKGTGMDELLDAVLLQAEMMELKANPKCPAEGTVVEAQMEIGRGPTATMIVQKGTLKIGDAFVCGQHYCKVRALLDDRGNRLKSVAPGNPALVLGWSGAPTPGSLFHVCKNEREARDLAEENAHNLRKALEEEADEAKAAKVADMSKLSDMDRLTAAIQQTKDKVFKVLCKADVNGTLEALIGCLEAIKSAKVKLEVIASSVGPITPNDVNVAHAGGAAIVAFDVKQDNGVGPLLKRTGVKVIGHNIIYMLLDMVKEEMSGLLDPELKENKVGMAEVRAVFPHGKNHFVAGCMVTEGRVQRDFHARIYRKNQVIHSATIDTLKRFKDDVTEVKAGYECGIRLENFEQYQMGDLIECYEILEVRPAL